MSRDSKNLVIIVSALLGLGMVLLFSSSAIFAASSSRMGDPLFFLKRQFVWLIMAGAALIAAARMPTSIWQALAVPLTAFLFVLLGLVFAPGVGAEFNGARRWIHAGPFIFQPSEMAKPVLAMFVAVFAARYPYRIRDFFNGFLPIAAVVAAAAGMIILEPDLGSALFIACVMGIVLFVGGAKPLHFAPFALAGSMGVAYMIMSRPYILERLLDFGNNYHTKQSLIALGSGGLFGVGLGRGVAKLFYLPEAHNDFILSILGEELGFLGVFGVSLLFLCIGLTGWRITWKCRDPFRFHLAFALTLYIILQAVINIAVVTAAVPTKGLPLPFLSYGGSSLMFTMAMVGVLIAVAEETDGARVRAYDRERGACEPSSPAEVPVATYSRGSL